MSSITKFEDIEAWQTARDLTGKIYTLTKTGAFSRDFGLCDQMRRAAVSVMSNIAEGYESRTRGLFIDYLGRAKASAGELRAQMYVALDTGYLTQAEFDDIFDLTDKCSRQLSKFISYLSTRTSTNV